MSWYKDDPWKDVITEVARATGRKELLIEKDVIQSLFLANLPTDSSLVFKGGTSLTKAYRLIDRFSEDLDFSVANRINDAGRAENKRQILTAAAEVGLELQNADSIRTRGNYNQYRFQYESLFRSDPQLMYVETSYFIPVHPINEVELHSYVGDYYAGEEPPFNFGQTSIKCAVQSLDRTLIDKVFAVCDYRIADMADRDSRHLYDIAKLLPHVTLDDNFKDLVDDVRRARQLSKNNPSAQADYNIPEMLTEIIDSGFYKEDYENLTTPLLYEDYSYDRAVNEGIAKLADTDIFAYREDIKDIREDELREAHKEKLKE